MNFGIDAAGAHEVERLGEAIGKVLIRFDCGESLTKDSIH